MLDESHGKHAQPVWSFPRPWRPQLSLAAHIGQRIESAIAGVYWRMDRRDAAVVSLFQQQGTRIAIAEYNLANLAAWVSNIAQQIGGYFTDAWRAPGGAE